MNPLLKHAIKELVPPFILQWMSGTGRDNDSWGRPTFSFVGARLPGGRKFHMRSSRADHEVFRQVFVDREYSFAGIALASELTEFYEACKDPLIIDAGANIGAASVWLALTYPKATIIAIEPDRENYELLKKNTKEFPLIIPINAAIASVSGSLYLTDTGQGAWAYRTTSQATANSYAVPSMTVEDVLARVPEKTPFVFKIDIEGAESEMFSNPSVKIDNFPMVAIELHDWMLPRQTNSRNFLRWHIEHNRDLVFRGENAFSIAAEFRLTK